MKKIISLSSIILTAVLIVAMLFSTGCTYLLPSPMPYGPRVTADGTGGAIVVYENIKGGNQRDFYAQRISCEGDTLWGDEGVLIGSGYKEADSFFDLHIVNDGAGGAIIAWIARPASQERTYICHVTRVDSEGSILWQKEVRGVNHLISDGAGGAIIATDYSYDERTLFVIKIDSEGNFPWGEDGVYVYREEYQDNSLQLAGDDAGGAIIIWQERHAPEITHCSIFAQRINSEGSLSWGQGGVLLYTPEEVYAEEARVASDGSGGAIVVWQRWPRGRVESGMPEALLHDICAQRVDADGNILWQPNGVPLEINKAAEGAFPHTPLVVTDGAGGAIVVWEDVRKGSMSLYAQKIDADGNLRWQLGGEEVCYIETHSSFWPRMAVSDGSGGAIVTYSNRAQRIDADGRTMWPGDGILFTDRGTHDLAYEGHGGAIIAWGSGKSIFRSERSYIQRISADGKLLWGEEGIRLNP